MWDLKDEKKFSSKEGARREQGGRKVHAEKWQAEIAKYETTRIGRLGLPYAEFCDLKGA